MGKYFSTKTRPSWLSPILGGIGGIIYATVDEALIKRLFGVATPASIVFAHDIFDFVLPVLFGILVGLAINTIYRQAQLNQKLSFQNAKLQRDLLVNTLTSLFLHEIRNPIHNITAALEDTRVSLPDEIAEMLNRNLKRLEETSQQYRKWGSLFDQIDPKEKTELRSWVKEFIENKVRSRLRELEIEYFLDIDPLQINMHPVLLDQCFTTLLANACEALAKEPRERQLRLIAHLQPPLYKNIEIKIINQGQGFSEEALKKQAQSPIQSKTGLGIGLTLLRKILELVEGEVILSNFIGHAEVSLIVPGEAE